VTTIPTRASFVDIHSHVLYGLDDGAKTIEESVAMLAIAEASGTTDIVATPHANSQFEFRPDVVSRRIEELQARTRVRIHSGCDFHLHVDNIQDALAHPERYTIRPRRVPARGVSGHGRVPGGGRDLPAAPRGGADPDHQSSGAESASPGPGSRGVSRNVHWHPI
jgi:hypothetical protein